MATALGLRALKTYSLPGRKAEFEVEKAASPRSCPHEVMIANCNKQGKQVNMAGQVIFQSFGRHSSDDVDAAVGVHLLMIGIAICLFFSICNLRISMGTRAEYTGTRLLPLFRDGAVAHEEYRVVRRQEEPGRPQGTGDGEDDSDDDELGSIEEESDDHRDEPRYPVGADLSELSLAAPRHGASGRARRPRGASSSPACAPMPLRARRESGSSRFRGAG